MFKTLLTLAAAATIISLASPVLAATASFQICVTVPPHAMPAKADAWGVEKTAVKPESGQTVQYQEMVRHDQKVTVKSVVAL